MNSTETHTEAEELFHVIGDPPHWIHRYGLSLIGLFFFIAFLLSLVIQYPDEIVAPVTLTSEDPPIRLYPKTAGEVEKLLVAQNQEVRSGDIIAVIKSSAEYSDVLRLEQLIQTSKADSTDSNTILVSNFSLGGLQPAFSYFKEMAQNQAFFLKFNSYPSQIASLKRQIFNLSNLDRSLTKQREILKEHVEIGQIDLSRNATLLKDNTISSLDYEKIKMSFLQQQRQLEALSSELISNQVQLEQMKSQLIEVNRVFIEEERRVKLLYREAMSKLESEIENWKQLYVISSPVTGKVTLAKIKSAKQFVTTAEEIAMIDPATNEKTLVARTFVKGIGIGKIHKNMKVVIQLDGYPYQEFGSLIGKISSISSVPQQDGYSIDIEVSQDLETTYKKKLVFIQELSGTARIVVENRTVGERIFDRIYSILKNRA